MNKPSTLRLITILAPLLCLILAIVLVSAQVRRLRAQEALRTQLTQQIADLDRMAREMAARPPLSKMAAAPPSPDEQPLFLNLVRGFADTSRVQLAKYENKTVPPPAEGSADAKANAMPANVIALTSNVEVVGSYNQVRQFMNQLWYSPRLFNTTELKWLATDKWPTTHLSFVLTRYIHAVDTGFQKTSVTLPAASPAPGAASSARPGSADALTTTAVLPAPNAAAPAINSAAPRSTIAPRPGATMPGVNSAAPRASARP